MTILDNILAGVIAVLVIALGVVLVMNADLRADLARMDANVAALSRANADLKNAAEKQNQAIANLQADGEAKARVAEKAVRAAALQAKHYAAEAAALAKQPVANRNDCAAATQILRDYLKDR